jgi:hypothetical protein
MKQKQTYSLHTTQRGVAVNIVRNSKVIGCAIFSKTRGWFIFNAKFRYVANTKEKENIIPMYRRKKGKAAPRKPRPLCAVCPLHKTDAATRKEIRIKALPKR